MRAVIQRVSGACVTVDGETVGGIDVGLLVYVGVAEKDNEKDAEFIARKIAELRLFEDESGKMNRGVSDVGGAVLIISNFTLCGNCRKGRRPSFDAAAQPDAAKALYEKVVDSVRAFGLKVEKGIFREHMHVESVNDGPVTLLLDSKQSRSES
jgi:D-tyrosyl-tRNA(Tyr) deacylase